MTPGRRLLWRLFVNCVGVWIVVLVVLVVDGKWWPRYRRPRSKHAARSLASGSERRLSRPLLLLEQRTSVLSLLLSLPSLVPTLFSLLLLLLLLLLLI